MDIVMLTQVLTSGSGLGGYPSRDGYNVPTTAGHQLHSCYRTRPADALRHERKQ